MHACTVDCGNIKGLNNTCKTFAYAFVQPTKNVNNHENQL